MLPRPRAHGKARGAGAPGPPCADVRRHLLSSAASPMLNAATRTLLLALCLAATGQASAAPEPPAAPTDAAPQFQQDWSLVPAGADAEPIKFVRQVRDAASDLVLSAMNFVGVPYRRGGERADQGFDCSGFTRHVFENSLGLLLPRRADQQAREVGLVQVVREDLEPGDLVFFNTMRRAFSHVGIYVGEGRFIHAPRSGSEVRVEDMRQPYWSRRFNGARRAAPAEPRSPQRP